ncbi:MAG: hypothetical protein U5O39_18990 [Gammaproteobacteria bacterium]|nr:hypothetical protein [Gammaproteobacteria bacterium]
MSLTEDDGTRLAGTSSASTSLTLSSAGDITDTTNASLTVTGNAALTANAGASDITLGDAGTDGLALGSVTVAANNVALTEDDTTTFAGTNTVGSALTVTSGGAITDSATTSFAVTGLATFNANTGASAITLGDNANDTTNFGSLDLTGSTVTVSEDSASTLAGLSVDSLDLSSTGAIDDAAGTTLTATGNVSLSAGTTITIGDDDTVNFGSVTLNGTTVSLTEDDGTRLAGTSSASTSLTLSSGGNITDTTNASLTVTGNAALTANAGASDITLGEATTDGLALDSVTVAANNVALTEDDATTFAGTNTVGGALTVTSGGSITDCGDDQLRGDGSRHVQRQYRQRARSPWATTRMTPRTSARWT